MKYEMRETCEIIDFMEEKQGAGGMSPHFSVDCLVDISGEEGCTMPVHCGTHCWEVQSLKTV